jgi:hypothetical protein
LPTGATAAAEKEKAQDRDVIPRADGDVAFRAAGAGKDDALFSREPIDADIEKAADDAAEEERSEMNHGRLFLACSESAHGD